MTNTVSAATIMAVAVGRGLADHGRADRMIGAAVVLDDHLLAPCRREALGDQARHHVAHAARRGRHHDGDGPGGIGLARDAEAGSRRRERQGRRTGRHSSLSRSSGWPP